MARLIIDPVPDQLKLPFFLWTREAVAALVADRLGLPLSVWTVGSYLKCWGFTPQRPIRRAFEQSPVQVQHWLEEEYPGFENRPPRKKRKYFGVMRWGFAPISPLGGLTANVASPRWLSPRENGSAAT
ncbi:MAG: winged helix-turn-helix domain-containing protein [Thermodesulfobacteriota bacterium]